VKEVKRITKVGSKRTPHYPAHCYETQGGREGSERRLYLPDEGTMVKVRRQESSRRQNPTTIRRIPGDDRSKGSPCWADQVNCIVILV